MANSHLGSHSASASPYPPPHQHYHQHHRSSLTPQPSPAPQQPQQLLPTPNDGAILGVSPNLEGTLVNLYQSLTELQTCAGTVVKGGENLSAGAGSRALSSLVNLSTLLPQTTAKVPLEVVDLLDADKNPHQHTRDQLERVSGENQFTRGKVDAIVDYTRQLEESLFDAFPELKSAMESGRSGEQGR